MAKFFDSPEMREAIRRIIRSRMALKGVEYRELARRLGELGVVQHESNLRSKVNNGSLGAQLLLFILIALDMDALDLGEVSALVDEVRSQDDSEEPAPLKLGASGS
ncbi:MAG: DUF6471 domain-containing protein [Pseudomonadales bacterium]